MKYILPFLIGCFIIFFIPSLVSAVSISIIDIPTTLTQDPFTVTASISGALAGANYLRIDLFRDGTEKYFGETQNDTDWYKGSEGTNYFPITIQSGTPWSGEVQGRIGTPTATEYDGTGSYKLKIRRYTSSGSYNSSESNESAVAVAIVFPTQTPIAEPTSEPPQAPTKELTNTPYPTHTSYPTKKPTAVIYKSPTPKKISPTKVVKDVLGDKSAINSPTSIPRPSVELKVKGSSGINPGIIFLSLGGITLMACAILAFYIKKKGESTS